MINLTNFIVCIITHIIDIIVFSKLCNQKIKINIKILASIIFLSIIDFVIGANNSFEIRIVSSNLITFIIFSINFNVSISKALLGTIITYFSYVIIEISMALVFYLILGLKDDFLMDTLPGILLCNVTVILSYLLLYNSKRFTNKISSLITKYNEKSKLSTTINIIIGIFSLSILMYKLSLNQTENLQNFIILLIMCYSFVIFVLGFFKNKSENIQLHNEYNNQLKYSEICKNEVTSKGKLLHEYCNQLYMIRGMVKKNKKAINFIDNLLEQYNLKIENDWIFKLDRIPLSYMNSFLALKIAEMNSHGIIIYLGVEPGLEKEKCWVGVRSNINDLTPLIGVFIDNARQASLESDEKQMIIELKKNDNCIEIDIGNTYSNKIDLTKINSVGYTTKGKGHGYGLSLAADIIDRNKNLSFDTEISGKFYFKKIKIKNKP